MFATTLYLQHPIQYYAKMSHKFWLLLLKKYSDEQTTCPRDMAPNFVPILLSR